jgi:pyruvate/oxaloacetate carboxyltransferase
MVFYVPVKASRIDQFPFFEEFSMLKLRLVLVPALLFSAQTAMAQEADTSAESWLEVEHAAGLTTNLPAPSKAQLKARLAELLARLRQRKAELSIDEEEARFGAKDAVITLVMPGGLLYAAFRQQQHHQTASQFEQVSAQLDELRSDLVAFRVVADDSLLASAAP